MEAFLRQDLDVLARDTEEIKSTLHALAEAHLAPIGCQDEDRFAKLVEHLEWVKVDVNRIILDCSRAVRCCEEINAWGLLEELCTAFRNLDAVLGDLKRACWVRTDLGIDCRGLHRELALVVLPQGMSSPTSDFLAQRV